jgi:peptidoglycan/xylan/chitin deacetylase (PgdA/CDA1 family)
VPPQPALSATRPRGVTRILVALTVLAVLSTPLAVAGQAATVVATGSVNIRSCPSMACDVLGQAVLGEELTVTGDPVDGFLPVDWHGAQGYAWALFVAVPGSDPWLREGDRGCMEVALVFNIGIGEDPSSAVVQALLDAGAPATMFPMGWWAIEHPAFLRMLDEAGFPIGTHGHGQVMLPALSDAAIEHDLRVSVEAIESVLGRPIDPYFTPYAAEIDARVRGIASRLGLLPVGWHVPAADHGPGATEWSVYDAVMGNVYPGAIVELHLDGPATGSSTALALPRIITDLRAEGYDLVTVPDLLTPCGA